MCERLLPQGPELLQAVWPGSSHSGFHKVMRGSCNATTERAIPDIERTRGAKEEGRRQLVTRVCLSSVAVSAMIAGYPILKVGRVDSQIVYSA